MSGVMEALCPICEDGVTGAELEEIAWDIVRGDRTCSVCRDGLEGAE